MIKLLIYFLKSTYKKKILSININRNSLLTLYFLKFIFFFSKKKLTFKNDYFFLKDKNTDIKFHDIKHSTFVYMFGIDHRIDYLKKCYFLNTIKFNDNDYIIDIGANNGDFSFCFKEKINYIGVEPSPKIFECLKYNVTLDNFKCYNEVAFDGSKEEVLFYIKDEGADSSAIEIKNYTNKIFIKTITLDKIISNTKSKKIKFIKIEAEGAEPEVLMGIKNKFLDIEYIAIDVGAERGVNNDYTIVECVNILTRNNFKLANFYIENTKNERVTVLFRNSLI